MASQTVQVLKMSEKAAKEKLLIKTIEELQPSLASWKHKLKELGMI